MKRKISRAAWLIAPVLLTVSVVGLGQPVAGGGGPRSSGPPDTYVAAWDAVGVQAFSAAGLTPAEGHTIFGYVGVAVYDAVMAVEGGYDPFAVDLDAPDGASSQAAVAAAARRILVHYLPASGGLDRRAGLPSIAGHHRRRPGQDRRHRNRRRRRQATDRAAGR